MKLKNKLLLTLTAASAPVVSSIALLSCQSGGLFTKSIDYDLGLATEPINNLNYVRYKSMDKIVPSLVDSYLKTGPTAQLKSLLNKASYNFVVMENSTVKDSAKFTDYLNASRSELLDNDGKGKISNAFYGIDNFQTVGGLADLSDGNIQEKSTIYAYRNPRNPNNYMAITGYTRKKQNMWSNGDFVTSNDIRDYLEYILDLNTGSQKLDTVRKYGIRAVDKFIDAQKEYQQKFKQSYKNPFGRRDYVWSEVLNRYIQNPNQEVFTSQIKDENGNPLDTVEVEAIKQAALEFGFYTGQLFLDYDNDYIAEHLSLPENSSFALDKEVQDFTVLVNGEKKQIKIVKNMYVNPYQEFNKTNKDLQGTIKALSSSENSFTMIFDDTKTPDLSYLLFTILYNLFPINRKHVETVAGGIDKYGSEPKTFLTSGPFKIAQNGEGILLGDNGYIILEKDKDYFDAENTISNKIKIMFSTNKNTNSLFFEDGLISQTYIPASKMNLYWSDPKMKKYLNKNTGYGTIAFAFNLDSETNGNSYLQDQDLRNAMYFAVNREKALKFVGWDFSFPVNTWTSYGQYKTFDGKNIEMFFEGQKSATKNGKEFDLQNYEFVVHLAKSFTFEKTERKDLTHDIQTAKYYLDRFKAKHPELQSVKFEFLNNGSEEQKNAGLFLKGALETMSNGYISIETKTLPENIYASFIEKGAYQIIYQNYDRLGGNGAQDYVSVFFKRDEVDTINQKTIAFKDNPVGSYIYGDYIGELVIEQLQKQDASVSKLSLMQSDINWINKLINSNSLSGDYVNIASDYNSAKASQSSSEIAVFVKKYAKPVSLALASLNEAKKARYSEQYVENLLGYIIINNKNIKTNRINNAFITYLATEFTTEQIANLTNETQQRLQFNQEELLRSESAKPDDAIPVFWNKFIELSLQHPDESISQYTSRINSFFSGNFTDEELLENWSQTRVYLFIAGLEKVIRDTAVVIPLMEVDTNWEITKVGGVDSLFRFSLQYAYDMTRPPMAKLPRTKEGN
ncbi:hypothetical protein [Mycoplasma sp. 21DD0573]|uniref:hypothetical protein n=1 Tax=unclassified Mycoplasma TaxID=2683645 RepID=UPI002B1D0C9C|nr:hypothetical protein [Mycoplasma sp. 21DD0573]MEA4276258.1 hypothetical protein [Mycoplasma sp. 21DD0573]